MADSLKKLETIQKVETPPFLITRLQEKIKAEANNRIRPFYAWALVTAMIGVFAVNIIIITDTDNKEEYKTKFSQDLQLIPNNNLY